MKSAPLALLAALALFAGCDQDRFLSGQWFTSELSTDGVSSLDLAKALGCDTFGASKCELYAELNLGHFGDDVVGIVRFFRDQNRTIPVACNEGVSCTCEEVQGRFVDGQFAFELNDCAGQRIRGMMIGTSTQDMQLRLESRDSRESLLTAFGVDATLTLSKTESEDQLTVEDKACEPCPNAN